ncbi:AglZ/HisF2 family acetamidino modification protein [Sphingobacterium faecale]|uniref:imidazole glycerol-phosphate synthase n=1 Tax=Sphingobacterium faecale TaxID=2803775 RepID=A0ABS1R6L3_9SPHI|nr:AglZ/HisF2 family acetamidino modification protein [Sphingobacterium faecale]MBL1410344.1 imidazole glycerol phosphate synthase subunit HisF [Sphingobacterium faecale]
MKRIIPVLLVHEGGLVKSIKFKNYNYVGDPINAVKIFNEKGVDEIVILDIAATKKKQSPDLSLIKEIASEAFMPLAYGGGITSIDQVKDILYQGVEKVVFNNSALLTPRLIEETAHRFGSSSTVVSVDVKSNLFGRQYVYSDSGKVNAKLDVVEYVKNMEKLGAGEIFLNSVDRDGTYKGYDLALIKMVSAAVSIPVVACGGAKDESDLIDAINIGGASASAAGSLFVYKGVHRAVLINYPDWEDIQSKISIKDGRS